MRRIHSAGSRRTDGSAFNGPPTAAWQTTITKNGTDIGTGVSYPAGMSNPVPAIVQLAAGDKIRCAGLHNSNMGAIPIDLSMGLTNFFSAARLY